MHSAAKTRNLPFEGIRTEVTTARSFDDVTARLHELCGHSSIQQLVDLAAKGHSEEQYVAEVTRQFVGKSGFMLFHEIDHGGWMHQFGIERKMVRWILGNPLIAITMLRHDLSSGLFAPVELMITEHADRNGSTITYVMPSSLIVTGDNPPLKKAAEQLDAKFAALIEQIAG
jgi:uncharacterized protein (DUF302 family)